MKSGFLYVLVHSSDPNLYKIGATTLDPEKRLKQHNRELAEYAGEIVKETGLPWKLKTFIEVEDPSWAKRAFWLATPHSLFPFLGGIEVQKMDWEVVQRGLEAAKKAGVRLLHKQKENPARKQEWLQKQLEGTGIKMLGGYHGLVRNVEFQCENGHVFKTSPGKLVNRKSCPCCVNWYRPQVP